MVIKFDLLLNKIFLKIGLLIESIGFLLQGVGGVSLEKYLSVMQ
jgi:hypothetical protein